MHLSAIKYIDMTLLINYFNQGDTLFNKKRNPAKLFKDCKVNHTYKQDVINLQVTKYVNIVPDLYFFFPIELNQPRKTSK